MTFSNLLVAGSLGANAVFNVVAVVNPPGGHTIGLVILANLTSVLLIRAAWKRAANKQAAAFIHSGPTLSVILREYADRFAALEDTPQ